MFGLVKFLELKCYCSENLNKFFWLFALCRGFLGCLVIKMGDYMEFYNHRRFHETLDYQKPMAVYFESLKINNADYENLVEIVAWGCEFWRELDFFLNCLDFWGGICDQNRVSLRHLLSSKIKYSFQNFTSSNTLIYTDRTILIWIFHC